jgi:hypothetical protein
VAPARRSDASRIERRDFFIDVFQGGVASDASRIERRDFFIDVFQGGVASDASDPRPQKGR